MPGFLDEQIKATGSARVVCVLKREPDANQRQRWKKHFRRTPLQEAAGRGEPVHHFRHLGIIYGTVTADGLRTLRKEKDSFHAIHAAPAVRPIRALKPRPAAAAVGVVSWGLSFLEIEKLWSEGLTGNGVLVGHLDTGVDATHPDLADAVASFVEVSQAGDVLTPGTPFDSSDHGTHTAGVIAARHKGGRIVGIAPRAMLASAIVMEGGDMTHRLLAGIDWAIGQGVRVLNCSLGLQDSWSQFQPVLRLVRWKNVLPVFAIGNEGPGTSRAPGNCPEALSVGAIDRNARVWPDSSSQHFQRPDDPIVPDLVMPGVDIISTDLNQGYREVDGTSLAAPHVSGLAALLWEAYPAATVAGIERAIYESCRRPAGVPAERVNRGVPNAARALEILRRGVEVEKKAVPRRAARSAR